MYLIDTDVIGDLRKGLRVNEGVRRFFERAEADKAGLWLSVVTVGEIRRGVKMIRRRDPTRASVLERWLEELVDEFASRLLPIDAETAQLWGCLRAPRHENSSDELIAATALINGLTVVTRNTKRFRPIGVPSLDPFAED